MIDGIHFGEHVVLVVVGIDATGEKRVLGLREGTTENAEVCRSLLRDLIGRGLDAATPVLVVADGGKGLAKAVREVFGAAVRLQRCQVHKMRNVLGHLPQKEHARVRSGAWREDDVAKAKSRLEALSRSLSQTYPSAAGAMRRVAARVKRWDGGTMVLRWAAAGLQEAEVKFRRIKGHQNMKYLLKALDAKADNDLQKAS